MADAKSFCPATGLVCPVRQQLIEKLEKDTEMSGKFSGRPKTLPNRLFRGIIGPQTTRWFGQHAELSAILATTILEEECLVAETGECVVSTSLEKMELGD